MVPKGEEETQDETRNGVAFYLHDVREADCLGGLS